MRWDAEMKDFLLGAVARMPKPTLRELKVEMKLHFGNTKPRVTERTIAYTLEKQLITLKVCVPKVNKRTAV